MLELQNLEEFRRAATKKYRLKRRTVRLLAAQEKARLVLAEHEELELIDGRIAELTERLAIFQADPEGKRQGNS